MTYKIGLLGALKDFQHKILQDYGLCGEEIDCGFSLIGKKSRLGLVMVRRELFLIRFHYCFGSVNVHLESHLRGIDCK